MAINQQAMETNIMPTYYEILQNVTEEDVLNAGKYRGFTIASGVDMPELDDVDEAEDQFKDAAFECEQTNRDFSPFEFTANELNELQEIKDFDVWSIFEDGIHQGVDACWIERYESFYSV